MRHRLKTPPAPEVIEHIFGPRLLQSAARDFDHMLQINRAHVLMLGERRLLSTPVVGRILHGLAEVAAKGAQGLEMDPALEELYYNMEAALARIIGADAAGRMHLARSRNDLYATISRMEAREVLLDLLDQALHLWATLLRLGAEHAEMIMPGYTHLQPAQPITLGYYLLGVAAAMERDIGRLEAAYGTTNRSPLGACAMAGTEFPIDRKRVADWLGFDDLVEHALDAVASRDYVTEALAAMAMLGITLGRLTQDLYTWCTCEFSLIELDDSVAATSSIMPQKKNPTTLEHVKARVAHLFGALLANMGALKGTPFSHTRDVASESVRPLAPAAQELRAMLALTDVTLRTLRPCHERAAALAQEGFATMTALADALVRDLDMPFRTAHAICASLTRLALERRVRPDEIDSALLDNAAREIIGRDLAISTDRIRTALDPRANVLAKTATGGPAPSEVLRMATEAQRHLSEGLTRQGARKEGLADASRRLAQAVSAALAGA